MEHCRADLIDAGRSGLNRTVVSQRQRDDWQQRAAEVKRLCADRQLPLWQKTHRVAIVYQDLRLDGLKSKHRHRIYSGLSHVNAILARYPIQTYDDYALIENADLRAIIAVFSAFGALKI